MLVILFLWANSSNARETYYQTSAVDSIAYGYSHKLSKTYYAPDLETLKALVAPEAARIYMNLNWCITNDLSYNLNRYYGIYTAYPPVPGSNNCSSSKTGIAFIYDRKLCPYKQVFDYTNGVCVDKLPPPPPLTINNEVSKNFGFTKNPCGPVISPAVGK